MVCTVDELSEWKDFPKGLKVLLLDEDGSEIKSQLEAMDYAVSIFCNEAEALSAIADNPEYYHIAIVEVNTSNRAGSFKFLETAKDLPIIMTSNTDCLSTTMKCIALGAVEFLRKPILEDKLKNIWQHVVHKAYNAGGNVVSESLKPVKDFVPGLKADTKVAVDQMVEEVKVASLAHESGNDKYPAPLTPQLKQGSRLLDDVDCQDHTNSSTEKECGVQEGESKSVETTFAIAQVIEQFDHRHSLSETEVKEENGLKTASNTSSHLQNDPSLPHSSGTRATRKKSKVDWTPELHKNFVQAVEQLGMDHAIPSKILEVMKVEGLTRHNVASHLQKYRMQKRHILPKADDRKWLQPRVQIQSYYPHKPIMAYPPYSPVYPMWRATSGHSMWGPPGYPPWPSTESWHWKPLPGLQADAWGCPVMPLPPTNYYSSPPPNVTGFRDTGTEDNRCNGQQTSFDQYPAQEVIDKVVKEAMSKPWLPLPLGLKPPAIDTVLAELSRQGISRVPPQDQRP